MRKDGLKQVHLKQVQQMLFYRSSLPQARGGEMGTGAWFGTHERPALTGS